MWAGAPEVVPPPGRQQVALEGPGRRCRLESWLPYSPLALAPSSMGTAMPRPRALVNHQ